jgi:hypothetical protein
MIFAPLVRDTLRAGSLAAVTTTATAAACGKVETGSASAPVNAISHILWGDRAARVNHPTLKHTLVGALLNTAAVTMWAGVFSALFGARRHVPRTWPARLAQGAFVAGSAYVVDYALVPNRLTPGFEKRLSGRSLLAIYTVLAASLALASRTRR